MNEYKYNYYDFKKILIHSAYIRLAKEGNAIRFLNHELEIINGYSKFIEQYPQVKCEPLEFLYQCLHSVSAMNPKLLNDLTNFNWRGAVWSAWLAIITPYDNRYFIPELEKISGVHPYNDWLVKLALKYCKNGGSDHELIRLSDKFRSFLTKMPKVEVPLRKWPSPTQERLYKIKCFRLKCIYRKKGTDAALRFLKKSKKHDWELSYNEWCRQILN